MRTHLPLRALICAAILATSSAAQADTSTQEFGTCLTDHTNGKERKDLARWIFTSMSAHPDLQALMPIPATIKNETDQQMAALVTRLLTQNCRTQAKTVMAQRGAAGFGSAFEMLGQVAMQELMTNPQVAASVTGFQKHLNQQSFKEAFGAP